MTENIFESSTISLVLAWIFAAPIFIGIIIETGKMIFEKYDGLPKMYLIWLFICILTLSPLRYLIMQVILATNYAVQSWSSFLTIFILVLYVPIIYGLLYAIGFSIPLLITFWLSGLMKQEQIKKWKLIISALLTPVSAYLGTYIFFLVLPFAAYTIHWLNPEDIIKSTNGPSYYYFKYAGSWLIPKVTPKLPEELNIDSKSKFRNHIASYYLSDNARLFFIKNSYPQYYETLPNASFSTIEYFGKSISYANEAINLSNQGEAYSIIDEADIEKVMELFEKAFENGSKCDITKLNGFYPKLGDNFRDKYLEGLRNLIEGYKNNQSEQFLNAQFQLDSWGEWYSANYQKITSGKKPND